jgi:ribosome-associated toxin RatA of RatAB toxin-antitoxin module
LHSAIAIDIHAPRETIFDVVRDLSRWPALLPHYRYVKFLEEKGARQVVRMACRRSGIPLAWTSAYEADPITFQLHFEHLRAWTKGMRVVWDLHPIADGTRVEIVHDLNFRVPALQWLADPIIGGFFIDHVATRTLRAFKEHLEGTAGESQPRNLSSIV